MNDKSINNIFPLIDYKEFESEGMIGEVTQMHYGFMGHILGPHLQTLILQTAPDVAGRLNRDLVDVVLLTPG